MIYLTDDNFENQGIKGIEVKALLGIGVKEPYANSWSILVLIISHPDLL